MALTKVGRQAMIRGVHDAGPFTITLFGNRRVRWPGPLGWLGFTRLKFTEIPDARQRAGMKVEGCELVNCDTLRWDLPDRTHVSHVGLLDRYGKLLARGPLDKAQVLYRGDSLHIFRKDLRLEVR